MKLKCIDIISIIGAIFGAVCIAAEIILSMKDTEVLESFNSAWEAMCRQYKEYQREEMRVALNMLGKIIKEVC